MEHASDDFIAAFNIIREVIGIKKGTPKGALLI